MVDKLPGEISFYNGDIDDAGPITGAVEFVDNGSGLSFNPASDVGFSNNASAPASFVECNYPSPGGYDSNITYVCFRPVGEMSHGTPDPSFTLRFKAKIK